LPTHSQLLVIIRSPALAILILKAESAHATVGVVVGAGVNGAGVGPPVGANGAADGLGDGLIEAVG